MPVLDDNEQPVFDEAGEKRFAPCRILVATGEGSPCKRDLRPWHARGWPCPRPPLDPRDEHVVEIGAAIMDPVGQSGCAAANEAMWRQATRFMTPRQEVRFRNLVAFYVSEYQRRWHKHQKPAEEGEED